MSKPKRMVLNEAQVEELLPLMEIGEKENAQAHAYRLWRKIAEFFPEITKEIDKPWQIRTGNGFIWIEEVL